MARLPETTRIARILEMVWLISREPKRWTRKELATRFEISERMVTEDFRIIREGLNFPLKSAYGLGYYFTSLPRLPAVSYPLPEAIALILAAQSARQLSGISQSDLATAIARMSAVIPEELREMVKRLEAGSPPIPADDWRQSLLATVSQAIATHRRLQIVYAAASRAGEVTERAVDPYAIVPYLRSWHLIGYCHLREDMRVFKIDRIGTIETLRSTFEPDGDFDLAAFLGEGWGLMRGLDTPLEQVELRFHHPAARWVAEEHWHTSQEIDWLDDGKLQFRVQIQITPEFRRWVFRYGSQVEIVAPDHLRDWVAEEARTVLEQSIPA